MSQENVNLVVGQFEAANVRDFAGVVDAWTEDVILVSHGNLAVVGVTGRDHVTGKEAVGNFFRDWFSQFADDYRFEIDESRDLDDRVLIVATNDARGRTSGVQVTTQSSYLYTVRGGKISRVEIWLDRSEALEAAGLSE